MTTSPPTLHFVLSALDNKLFLSLYISFHFLFFHSQNRSIMGIPTASLLPLLMEMCTAFSYLGFMNNLTPYLKNTYHLSDSTVIFLVHLFAATATSIPVGGAYLADNLIGRFRVVCTNICLFVIGFSLVLVGSVGVVNDGIRLFCIILGSFVVAVCVGTGRSLTATFAADQMPPSDVEGRASVFSSNYLMTNSAVVLAVLFLPPLKYGTSCWGADECHSAVYAATLISVILGLVFFMSGLGCYNREFVRVASVNKVVRCCVTAMRGNGEKAASDSLMDSVSDNSDEEITGTGTWLDRAYPRFTRRYIRRVYNLILTIEVSALVAIVFFAMFYQVFSSFILQSSRLNPRLGRLVLSPEIITAMFPISNVLGALILNSLVYKLAARVISVSFLRRMGVGALLASLSFLIAGIIQHASTPLSPAVPFQTLHYDESLHKCKLQIDEPKDGLIYVSSHLCSFYTTIAAPSSPRFIYISSNSSLPPSPSLYPSIHLSVTNISTDRPRPDIVRLYFGPQEAHFDLHQSQPGGNLSLRLQGSAPFDLAASSFYSDPVYTLGYQGLSVQLDTRHMMGGAYYIGKNGQTLELSEILPPNSVSLLWQLLPVVLLALAEVFLVLSGFEFAFSQSPRSLKAIMQSTWLLFALLGNILTMSLSAVPPAYSFFIYSGLMFLCLLGFVWKTHDFLYFTYENTDIDDASIPSDTLHSSSVRTDPTLSDNPFPSPPVREEGAEPISKGVESLTKELTKEENESD